MSALVSTRMRHACQANASRLACDKTPDCTCTRSLHSTECLHLLPCPRRGAQTPPPSEAVRTLHLAGRRAAQLQECLWRAAAGLRWWVHFAAGAGRELPALEAPQKACRRAEAVITAEPVYVGCGPHRGDSCRGSVVATALGRAIPRQPILAVHVSVPAILGTQASWLAITHKCMPSHERIRWQWVFSCCTPR